MSDYIINNLTKESTWITVQSKSNYAWYVKFDLSMDWRAYDSGLKHTRDTPSAEWLAGAKEAAVAAFNKVQQRKEKSCYVRYGKPPSTGVSYNYKDNCVEPGVSVYPAVIVGDEILLNLAGIDITSFLFIQENRKPYFIEGDVVGHGSDGEPCLKVKKIKTIPKKYNIRI